MPDIDDFIREQAKKLREKDEAPRSKADWEKRRTNLRAKMFAAMGEFPEKPCDLEPRVIGTLKRDGYAIEKLIFQSRPNVWVTATAYVPDVKGKVPAVLVVHGHWAWARRDPVVQSRCLGLAKLGFFVLAVDAFGAGERFTNPARGTYHGALYGSTLWPSGHTLLGMQVYDNRRAVDYILSRPEVNGKLGITGASGGGNQSMYAGALDERFGAVVPVCSIGNFQAYLKAACCVCEVLPGALTFTEEGDVLGLVAPRALLVINASKDGIQFSPAEAEKSVARAKEIYKLIAPGSPGVLKHQVFESPHDYNQQMREAMYGWMTLHLKGEGKGEPIPEPKLTIEKPEDLACFPDPKDRPKGFLTPPLFAAMVGKELIAKADKLTPDHKEMWEATAIQMREDLRTVLSYVEPKPRLAGMNSSIGFINETHQSISIYSEDGVTIAGAEIRSTLKERPSIYASVFQYDKWDTDKPPTIWEVFRKRLKGVSFAVLRGTGRNAPKGNAIAGAPDHNLAEHAVWSGRSLLSQWTTDIAALNVHLGHETNALVGIGPAAVPVLLTGALLPKVAALILIDPPVSYVTDTPYAAGTPMGILAPGILKVGDIPHLAGLIAPRRLIIAGGAMLNGKKLNQKELQEAFAFTTKVYKAMKVPEKLTITDKTDWEKIEL
jgi:cephalosporin-C deacetylase-like acetyl esterase